MNLDLTDQDISTETKLSEIWEQSVRSGALTPNGPLVCMVTIPQYRGLGNFVRTDNSDMIWGIGPYQLKFLIDISK